VVLRRIDDATFRRGAFAHPDTTVLHTAHVITDAAPARPSLLRRLASHSWIAQLGIVVAFVALAAWQVDLGQVADAFTQVRYEWLAVSLGVYIAGRLLHAWEWQIVLTKVGRAPFFGLFGVLLVGTLVNAVLPANLGDVAKVQIMANRYGLPRAGLIAGRGAESVVNGLMFVIFVFVSLLMAGDRGAPKAAIWAMAGICTGVCISAIAVSLMMPETMPGWRILRRLPGSIYRALTQHWPRLHDGFEAIRRPRLLVILLLLNVAGWVVDIAIEYAYGHAFNLDVPLGAYISVTVVLSLITTFPITFGNVGSWEFGVLGVLALYNVPSDQALAYAVGAHVFMTVFNIAVGLVAMMLLGVKLRDLLALRGTTHNTEAIEATT
jgi:uncharacterized protein (TIRG00374 family)